MSRMRTGKVMAGVLAAALGSDAASFITGTNHVVDCGHLCMTSEMMVRK